MGDFRPSKTLQTSQWVPSSLRIGPRFCTWTSGKLCLFRPCWNVPYILMRTSLSAKKIAWKFLVLGVCLGKYMLMNFLKKTWKSVRKKIKKPKPHCVIWIIFSISIYENLLCYSLSYFSLIICTPYSCFIAIISIY